MKRTGTRKVSVVYGAKIKIKDGDTVVLGKSWWNGTPIRLTILTEVGGKIAYGDIVEGVTMKEDSHEVTGPVTEGHHRTCRSDATPSCVHQGTKGERRQQGLREWPAMWPGTYCRSARIFSSKKALSCIQVTCSRRFPRDDQDQGHHGRSPSRGGIV